MMRRMDPLSALPEVIVAGTTVIYTRALSDYPANAGWVLTLTLAGKGRLSVTAAPSGADHVVTLAASETAALAAGSYRWDERVSKAGATYVVGGPGNVTVLPDLVTAPIGELEDPDEKLLAIVEAALAGRLSSDMEAFQIAGRAVTKIPAKDLLQIRAQLRSAVARRRSGGKLGRQHRIAFTGAENEASS
jgi:hypothetical protein